MSHVGLKTRLWFLNKNKNTSESKTLIVKSNYQEKKENYILTIEGIEILKSKNFHVSLGLVV